MGALDLLVEEQVSSGRFAEVWRAREAAGERRRVALKVATTDLGARMLRAEAAALERLRARARCIVPSLAFVDGPRPALVLAWIEGPTLRQALEQARSEDERAALAGALVRVVEALACVHDRMAHGDLKPENVMLAPSPPRGRLEPWLLDFGLARERWQERLGSTLSRSLSTEDEVTGGTLAYLPPEAVKGAEPSTHGDVYAVGVMLHEVLLGRRPDKLVSPDELRRLLPEEVALVLLRALAFDPKDRYADAQELLADLGGIEPVICATGRERRLRAARRMLVAGLAAFFVGLRYTSVAALVALYVGLAALALTKNPWWLSVHLAFLILHVTIRWEGPETPEEQAARREGRVVVRPRGRG